MSEYGFSLHPYFKEMPGIGKALNKANKANTEELKNVEAAIAAEIERVKNSG